MRKPRDPYPAPKQGTTPSSLVKPTPTSYRSYEALSGKERTLGFLQVHEFSKRFWDGAKVKWEGVCTCGEHIGLTLLDRNGKVHEFGGARAEGLCLISFWLARAQIVLTEHGGKEVIKWVKEHPLQELTEKYSLESIGRQLEETE